MKKFDSLYTKESTALQIVKRNTLENIKLSNFKDVVTFFDEFEKAANELKAAAAKITEPEKLRYMLKALPQSYSYLGDLIDVLPLQERTVEYLKSKIMLKHLEEENEKDKIEKAPTKSNVFSLESNVKCYGCGKMGHIQRQCQQFNSNGFRGRGRQYQTSTRGRRNGYRGHRGRGNFRGTANTTMRYTGYQTDQQLSGNMFLTEVSVSEVHENIVINVDRNRVDWILDSGCTDHVTNNESLFSNSVTLKEPIQVKLGDGRIVKATKVGNINSMFKAFNNKCQITLRNVFLVKDMKKNLLSYSRIMTNNRIESFGNITSIFNYNNELIATAINRNNLLFMTSYINNKSIEHSAMQLNLAENNRGVNITEKERWHRVLGHVNFNNLNNLCNNKLLLDLPEKLESQFMKCATCIQNKMPNKSFDNNRKSAKEILELIHTDVNGPHATVGNNGERYFVTFIDNFSKLAKVYCIRSKSEIPLCLREYVNQVENLTGKKVKTIRCDNGKEYINSSVQQFIREKGIRLAPCPPYIHELNGVAERYNRTIMNMARCLLSEANVGRLYWPEVIKTAAFLKNRTLVNTIIPKTPYEIFFNEKARNT